MQLVLGIFGVLAPVSKAVIAFLFIQTARASIKVATSEGRLAKGSGVIDIVADTPDRELLGFSLVGAHDDKEHGEGQGNEVGDLERHLLGKKLRLK